MTKIKELKIVQLRRDGGTQPRVAINPDIVREYADEMKNGREFPSVIAFFDGLQYWLADGYHRVEGALLAGKEHIAAEIRQGSVRDAQLFAVGANAAHGMRRSNEDKRKAVTTLLEDKEWQKWSDTKISQQCAVSGHFVGVLRKELSLIGSKIERLVERNGTVYPMDVGKIGKSSRAVADDKAIDGNNSADAIPVPAITAKSDIYTTQHHIDQCENREKEVPNAAILDNEQPETVIDPTIGNPPDELSPAAPAAISSFEILAKWSWVPVTPGPTPNECVHGILLTVPGDMPVDKRLKSFVNHAARLKCSVFVTPSLHGLIDNAPFQQSSSITAFVDNTVSEEIE